jgi:XTP/dITP diphosphohydrolase
MSKEKITEIVVATTNQRKLKEIKHLLAGTGVTVRGLDQFAPLPEAEETGKNFAENARQKATWYGKLLDRWVLADDSGLEVIALDLAPGVHSARFAGVNGPDAKSRDLANNNKLLGLLAEVPQEQRIARFRCSLCLCHGMKVMLEVDGFVDGVIISQPRGENGFGYDPIFFLPQLGKTAAELTNDEKNAVSHRGMALKNLLVKLKPLLQEQ